MALKEILHVPELRSVDCVEVVEKPDDRMNDQLTVSTRE